MVIRKITMSRLTLASINAMSALTFVQTFANIIEHSDWVAQEAFLQKPFKDGEALHQAMVNAVRQKGPQTWERILCLHPELSGKEAVAGTLTHFSTQEQAGIGLNALSPEHFAHMREFNRRYREKFGFPFVICVRLVKNLDELFTEQNHRIQLSREEELNNGINQVYEIARLRLEQAITY